MKPVAGSEDHKTMENYVLISSKSKANIEKALSSFMEMASSEVQFKSVLSLWKAFCSQTI